MAESPSDAHVHLIKFAFLRARSTYRWNVGSVHSVAPPFRELAYGCADPDMSHTWSRGKAPAPPAVSKLHQLAECDRLLLPVAKRPRKDVFRVLPSGRTSRHSKSSLQHSPW